jgi:predicted Fe-S protein YdhL (DUF1289 family)
MTITTVHEPGNDIEARNTLYRGKAIDPKAKLCLGCGRTLPEIARWHKMDNGERLAVMATLQQRMQDAGLPIPPRAPDAIPALRQSRCCMMRGLMIVALVVSAVGFLLSISNPVAFASVKGAALIRVTDHAAKSKPVRAVEIARSDSGEFSLRAKINGVSTPMVIDTGATSVVLTYETPAPQACRWNCWTTAWMSKPPAAASVPRG